MVFKHLEPSLKARGYTGDMQLLFSWPGCFLIFKVVTAEPGAPMRGQIAIAGGVFFAFFLLALFTGIFFVTRRCSASLGIWIQ